MRTALLALIVGLAQATGAAAQTNAWRLENADLSRMSSGWGKALANVSIQEKRLSVGGRAFERGVGTHASSTLRLDLHGTATRFQAWVGVDDEVGAGRGSVIFRVVADGRRLYDSAILRGGEPARRVDVDVRGCRILTLSALPSDDGIDFDHADWCDAVITHTGAPPMPVAPPKEAFVRLTPPTPRQPRINWPRLFGVRPGSPILFTVPTSGERPMRFRAHGLPAGVTIDAATGAFRGSIAAEGEWPVRVTATNRRGSSTQTVTLRCGGTLALTPPMGWSTWYMAYTNISDAFVRRQAEAMRSSGLADHGYSYINIDDGWNIRLGTDDPVLGGAPRDGQGSLRANALFPDMRSLCDAIHGQGLKAGIYISPGPSTCAGFEGSWRHEAADAKQFADWGFDFLKYDWCSYGNVAGGSDRVHMVRPYQLMGDLLRLQNRDIVYNLCQYGMGEVQSWGTQVGGNFWRTTGDLGAASDLWESTAACGFGQAGKEAFAGPGGWNDPDNILLGRILWRGALVPTPLTPNEQYTYMSLWSILAAPLVLSGDLTQMDDFTLGLLSNDEVIAVNQDVLGVQGKPVLRTEETEVWAKPLAGGEFALGLFNRGDAAVRISAPWKALGITGQWKVRDLWRQRGLGARADRFGATVPRHGVVFVRLSRD